MNRQQLLTGILDAKQEHARKMDRRNTYSEEFDRLRRNSVPDMASKAHALGKRVSETEVELMADTDNEVLKKQLEELSQQLQDAYDMMDKSKLEVVFDAYKKADSAVSICKIHLDTAYNGLAHFDFEKLKGKFDVEKSSCKDAKKILVLHLAKITLSGQSLNLDAIPVVLLNLLFSDRFKEVSALSAEYKRDIEADLMKLNDKLNNAGVIA